MLCCCCVVYNIHVVVTSFFCPCQTGRMVVKDQSFDRAEVFINNIHVVVTSFFPVPAKQAAWSLKTRALVEQKVL